MYLYSVRNVGDTNVMISKKKEEKDGSNERCLHWQRLWEERVGMGGKKGGREKREGV